MINCLNLVVDESMEKEEKDMIGTRKWCITIGENFINFKIRTTSLFTKLYVNVCHLRQSMKKLENFWVIPTYRILKLGPWGFQSLWIEDEEKINKLSQLIKMTFQENV